ncbi:protein kinase domain-containing protein [Hyalangium gracile]|uniref:protein kinase domain-containing protein n=1 Tax=Hyalangium gracile TaxID=394092 RepID=UPI001CC98EC3|nr:bifunctional serine/threonine-protein kinase/formylglycine-generating enzyme family protein [Hyalangium gracile]
MLCYRCGSHVPDTTDTCPTCGQKFDAAARQASGASARKRGGVEGAPYKQGDVAAGRYVIKELLGAGPVGYVFRAQDRSQDVDVAFKVINPRLLQEPEERTQFSLVMRVGKKLNHPYLSRVYEEGLDQDRPYFTSQVIEGMPLRRMMEMRAAKGQPFTLKEVEPLLSQLGAALDAAHRYGPHSDLKPENIIVLPDVLKVTDYGLALGIPRLPFVQAQKGYRAEGYIAPEYVSNGEIDSRMDIYSLAVIVGEMLTGLMPDADGIPEVLMKNPDLPPAFEALYRRALNSNPLARPKTAGEFSAEFSSIVAKGPAALKRPAPQAAPLGSSALTQTARSSEKPPPPVPTDQLPIASVSPPLPVRSPPAPELPPVDATQPMDAAMLAAIMAAPPVAAAKPDGADKPPEPRLSGESRPGRLSASGQPPASSAATASAARAPAPAATGARQSAKQAAPRTSKKVEKRSMPALWLVLLTVAGLATGSAVGYLILKRMGPPGQENGGGLPAQPPRPPPTPSVPSAPSTPAEVGPMVPVGRCPSGMKLVSGGAFNQGAPADEQDRMVDERPLRSVQVVSFCIDEYEYPNQKGAQPRVSVTWEEARQLCDKEKKRLCREEEWEKACKGPGSSRYPYPGPFNPERCNTDDAQGKDRKLAEAGRFEECRSAYQVADLSGNVAEWTSSPFTGNDLNRTQKGGAFDRPGYAVRCSARISGDPGKPEPTVGFRCCADVQP